MAATQQQIIDFLTYLTYARSTFMDSLNLKERLGHLDTFKLKLQNTILGYYVDILVDFFSQSDYENNNFMEIEDAQLVIDRINKLCDSNYKINW